MTAIATPPPLALPEPVQGDGFRHAYGAELQKLSAQLTTRLLVLVAVIGPFVFAVLLKVQSGTPSDALFGAWVHTSGFAISLVILGFAGSWGFPIIAGVLAGDLFASEDRHGTWKTILTRSCTREDVFAGKVLAAGTFVIAIAIVLAVSSLVAGIGARRRRIACQPQRRADLARAHARAHRRQLAVLPAAGARLHEPRDPVLGRHPQRDPRRARPAAGRARHPAARPGRQGRDRPHAADRLAPSTAGTGCSSPTRSSARCSSRLPSALAWIAACLAISWRIFRRRDFLATTATRSPSWIAPIRVVAIATVVVAVLALCSSLGPTGVTAKRLSVRDRPDVQQRPRCSSRR